MIRYALKCDQNHGFESWFKSAEAFDKLRQAGHVVCPTCGSIKVEKALMAPRVKTKDAKAPEDDASKAIAAMRKHVEENSTYVGGNFAQAARDMHNGDAPEESIWGEAKPAEAKALIEDGIPVAPLPFIPKRQAN